MVAGRVTEAGVHAPRLLGRLGEVDAARLERLVLGLDVVRGQEERTDRAWLSSSRSWPATSAVKTGSPGISMSTTDVSDSAVGATESQRKPPSSGGEASSRTVQPILST